MRNYARMPTTRHGARQRVAAWRLALVVLLVLGLVLMPLAPARAAVNDPSGGGDYNAPRVYFKPSETSYIVVAPSNQFDAALGVIGKGNSRIQLTNDKMAYLSNASTGGSFYLLATYMRCASDAEPAWAESTNNFVASARFFTAKGMYGSDFVWWADNVSSELRSAALRDFNEINNNGVPGGGSIAGDDLTFTVPMRYVVGTNGGNEIKFTGTDSHIYTSRYRKSGDNYIPYRDGEIPSNLIVNLHDVTFWDGTTQLDPVATGISVGGIRVRTPSNTSCHIALVLGNGDIATTTAANPVGTGSYYSALSYSVPFGNRSYYSFNDTNSWTSEHTFTNASSGARYEYSNGVLDVYFDDSVKLHKYVASSTKNLSPSSSYFTVESVFGLLGSATVAPPTNNWPEPRQPDIGPPDVPGPGVDPLPEPQSPIVTVDPTPGNVTVNVTVEPSNTTPADYTPWFRAILQVLNDTLSYLGTMLNALRADLADHCYHIRKCIEDNTLYLASSIGYKMQGIMTDFEFYLKTLFEWLANQFAWSFTDVGYDDSSIVMWLRRIYQRLNGGTPSIPDPVDPDAEGGYLDWLWDLIHNLMIDLLMIGGGALDGIVETIGDLIHLFPLSVPWDIAALLALFVAEPVTPAFEFDMAGEVYTWSYDYTISVDLHWLDDAMETVRTLELIAFAGVLLWRTKDLLQIFDWVGLSKQ